MSAARILLGAMACALVACGGQERPQAHGMVESIRATTPLDDQLAVAILEEVAPGCTQAGLRTSAQQRAYVHLRLSDLERAIAAGQYQEARVALRDLQVQAQDHESAVVDLRQRSEARR